MESLITAGWLGLIGSRSALSTGLTNPEALEAITSTLPYRCDLISVDRRPHYHHIHLQDRTTRGTGSFYYDYTEEFENEAPYEPEYAAPLCPIPQRAGGTRHPFLLRTDGTETTDDSDTPPTIDSSGTNFKGGLYKDNYSSDSMLAERGSIAQLSEGSQHDLLVNEEVDGEKVIIACQEEEQFREGFPEIPAPSRPENQLSQLEELFSTNHTIKHDEYGAGHQRRNGQSDPIY
ncbi:hypothetical protein CEP51_006493 [Fusarium floridanum]|uniref:Uncharacterized protein n=1 Tax=Fusarium floridanum TaxID=1325733 RepID=A0A428RSL0_9HYPO|nr:hypothetical protein CEP51_006493 [Fusarium floridanum]